MTEPAPDDTLAGIIVHPSTGELVEPTLEAAVAAAYAADVEETELKLYRRALSAFIAGELDRRGGKRTANLAVDVGEAEPLPVEVEVNPPTTEEYLPDVLLAALEPVIKAGRLDPGYVDRELVYTPAPPTPAPKVSKVELNKLKKSTDVELLAAIARARIIQPTTRTARVKLKKGKP